MGEGGELITYKNPDKNYYTPTLNKYLFSFVKNTFKKYKQFFLLLCKCDEKTIYNTYILFKF